LLVENGEIYAFSFVNLVRARYINLSDIVQCYLFKWNPLLFDAFHRSVFCTFSLFLLTFGLYVSRFFVVYS